MENKLNLVEILKDCPKGMELYSPLCGDCKLYDVNDYNIKIEIPNKDSLIILRHDGTYYVNGEIMLFPKGKTSWEGFHRPFKNGDVLFVDCSDDEDKSYQYIFILNKPEFYGKWHSYCHLDGVGHFHSKETYLTDDEYHPRFATEEEKAKLFETIKDNGYRWDDETKTLEKLTPKFKDGDVVAAGNYESTQLFLLKHVEHRKDGHINTGYCYFGWDFYYNRLFEEGDWGFSRLATEEEKAKLFETIKANGYEWNEGTKTLEKLTPKPKFKVGDRIKYRSGEIVYRIVQITEDSYVLDNLCSIPILIEHMYNLVPNKFDINSLIPFESRVLVRSYTDSLWRPAIFGFYKKDNPAPYFVLGGTYWKYCIPYEGNEHLRGKVDDCDSFYKNW